MATRKHSIGQMRERVTIAQESGAADTGGGRAVAWTTLRTVWAKVVPINGREIEVAEGLQAEVSTLIVVRYGQNSDVTAGMRATVRSVNYNIRAVIDPELRREWLELLCDRGTAV